MFALLGGTGLRSTVGLLPRLGVSDTSYGLTHTVGDESDIAEIWTFGLELGDFRYKVDIVSTTLVPNLEDLTRFPSNDVELGIFDRTEFIDGEFLDGESRTGRDKVIWPIHQAHFVFDSIFRERYPRKECLRRLVETGGLDWGCD